MRAWTSPDVPRLDARAGRPGARPRHRRRRRCGDRDPVGRGADVRLRHHAVRRHAPRPRRDVRRLRPAEPGLARRRPRGALRAERHRRRRPAAGAGRPRPAWTGRELAERETELFRERHGRAAGARRPTTTSARSSRSRSSSRWSSSCSERGARLRRRRRPVLLRALRPARSARCPASTEDEMLEVFAERGGDPDRPGKKDPLDCLLWQARAARRAGLGHRRSAAAGPAGTSSARRSRCTTSATTSTSRAAAATWSSRTTR